MKCIHCGLPLSSTRTQVNCPRCGMSTTPGQESKESSGSQSLIPAHQVGYAHSEHSLGSSAEDLQAGHAALPRTQSSGWGPLVLRTQPPTATTTTWEPSSQTQPAWQYDSEHMSNRPRMEPRKSKRPGTSSNIGLVVAGLCVFTSALILIFVYFMATGLTNDAPGTERVISQASTATTIVPSPSPVSSPTVAASSTPVTLPGEQFIDNAQMASVIDFSTAKVTTPASTFSINQKVYVTFDLHPNSQAGAACLSWYLNGKKIAHFEFAVPPSISRSVYSYEVYQAAGAGSVHIYWASSIACTSKLLAQEVNFSVTG
jgi:hypothetical protein